MLVLLAAFVLGLGLAARAYPGGSWADATAPGFQPFVNYWCDLMRSEGMNGAPNATGAWLAQAAFCALAASLAGFWWVAASLLGPAWLAWVVVASGTVSSVCTVLVALVPNETHRVLHSVTTMSAGCLGFAATVVLIAGTLRAGLPGRWRRAWGVGLLATALVNIVAYAGILLEGGESDVLPVAQKVATLFLLLWMVATVLAARPPARNGVG